MPLILDVESEALNWLTEVINEPLEESKTFQDNLKDGTILCKAFNKLFPEYKIKYNCTSMPFKQMENIASFLHGLSVVPGIRSFDLFTTVDLYEGKNLDQVKRCILAFKRIAEKNRLSMPMHESNQLEPAVEVDAENKETVQEEEFIEVKKTEEVIEEEEFVNVETEGGHGRNNPSQSEEYEEEVCIIEEEATEPDVVLYEESDCDNSEFYDVFHTSTESQKEVSEEHEIFTVENPGTFEIEISN